MVNFVSSTHEHAGGAGIDMVNDDTSHAWRKQRDLRGGATTTAGPDRPCATLCCSCLTCSDDFVNLCLVLPHATSLHIQQ